MKKIGFDVGTFNLVVCRRNEEQNFEFNREVNAFIEIPLENDFVFNMMNKAGVPLIKHEDANVAYALGEAAVNMAYTMPALELRRPMKDGCVNPKEQDAFEIMNIMMHSLIGEIEEDETLLCYCIPANAVNAETDADYHHKIIEAILKAYTSENGYKVKAKPINEGMALVYSELQNKMFTGIGVSCGGGMVNVAFSLYGAPVFTFAIVNSGDWIDRQAAKATNETIAFINREKHKIDLEKEPKTLVERAIRTQYEIMLEKTVAGIKAGLEKNNEKSAKLQTPVDIVVAGGTASPNGFDKMFETLLRSADLPIQIGQVIKPVDPLYAVARGCLIAAENS